MVTDARLWVTIVHKPSVPHPNDFSKLLILMSISNIVEYPGAGLSRLITINSELNGAV